MQRNKFEGRSNAAIPDPNGPLRRSPMWIFDNQVEHASRENGEDFGLILLTMLVLRSLSSAAEAVTPATSVVWL